MKSELKAINTELDPTRALPWWSIGLATLVLGGVFFNRAYQDEGFAPIDEASLYQSSVEDAEPNFTANLAPFFAEDALILPAPDNEPKLDSAEVSQSSVAWQQVTVQANDTLHKIFQRIGLSARQLHEFMQSDDLSARFAQLKPKQILHYQLESAELRALKLELALGHELTAQKTSTGYKIEQLYKPLQKRLNFAAGLIQSSFNQSAYQAGLDRKLVSQMVDIFGWDINFASDVRQNDQFKVLYEENHIEGQKVGNGDILALEFINQGRTHRAIRYTDAQGFTAYYSPEGHSLQKAFIRTPLKFTRISSHFGRRRHPILHTVRHHKGVDYAAPIGTPVKAMGNGKVVFAGTKRGYGKVIILQHGPKYRTLYAHLSRFAAPVRPGSSVTQGQVIGNVGMTGMTSGAHLHLEFMINGVHQDPLKVALPKANSIEARHRQEFLAHATKMIDLLNSEDTLKLAQNLNYGKNASKQP